MSDIYQFSDKDKFKRKAIKDNYHYVFCGLIKSIKRKYCPCQISIKSSLTVFQRQPNKSEKNEFFHLCKYIFN